MAALAPGHPCRLHRLREAKGTPVAIGKLEKDQVTRNEGSRHVSGTGELRCVEDDHRQTRQLHGRCELPPAPPGGCKTPPPRTRGLQRVRGRPRCYGVAGGCAGRSRAPPAGRAPSTASAEFMPAAYIVTLRRARTSLGIPWGLPAGSYLLAGTQRGRPVFSTRHHLQGKPRWWAVGQLVAAAEGCAQVGRQVAWLLHTHTDSSQPHTRVHNAKQHPKTQAHVHLRHIHP